MARPFQTPDVTQLRVKHATYVNSARFLVENSIFYANITINYYYAVINYIIIEIK